MARMRERIGMPFRMPSQESTDATHTRKPLTERQRDVVRLLMRGFDTPDIAKALGITVRGVKARLNGIYKVFGITNRYCKRIRLVYLLHEESRARRGT